MTDPEVDVNDFPASSNGLAHTVFMAAASCQANDKKCKERATDAENAEYDYTKYVDRPVLDCNAPRSGAAPGIR